MRKRIRDDFDLDEAPPEPRHEKRDMEQIIAAFHRPKATEVAKFLDALLSKTGGVFPRILGLINAVLDTKPDEPYKFIEHMHAIYEHLSPRGVSELTGILECFKVAPGLLHEKTMIMQAHYGYDHYWYSSKPVDPNEPKEKEPDLSHLRGGRNGGVYRTPTEHRRHPIHLEP